MQAQLSASSGNWEDEPAKFEPIILLDSVAKLECIYTFAEIDTVLQKGRNHELILQIGENRTMQIDLNIYLCDSIYQSHKYQMNWRDTRAVYNTYRDTYPKAFVRSKDSFSERETFILSVTECTDSCVRFDWQLHDDTLTVCGYTCRKAVANFRGRTWTAWYTEQIPIDAGPWKLHGLPGLILKASDQNFQHDFEAVAVRKPHFPFIQQAKRRGVDRVSRQRFREIEYDTAVNFFNRVKETGLTPSSSSSNSRRFYSPLELE